MYLTVQLLLLTGSRPRTPCWIGSLPGNFALHNEERLHFAKLPHVALLYLAQRTCKKRNNIWRMQ